MPELQKARAEGKIAKITKIIIRERNDRARQDNTDPNHIGNATTSTDSPQSSTFPTPAPNTSAADAGPVGSEQGARCTRDQNKKK